MRIHNITELPNIFKGEIRKALKISNWYTPDEPKRYLIVNNYSKQIADELCEQYAKNLSLAFDKGKSFKTK